MTNEIKEAITEALELVYLKKIIKGELLKAINELEAKNDRWITLKPHGKEADDYKRLLIKDGEDIEDAMHRQGYYKKRQAKDEQKEKEAQTNEKRIDKYDKRYSELKADYDKNRDLYMKVSKEIEKHREEVIHLIGDITDKNEMNKIVEKYIEQHPEVNDLNKKLEQADKAMQDADEAERQYGREIAKDILDTDIESLTKEELDDLKLALDYTQNIYVGFDLNEKLFNLKKEVIKKIKGLKYSASRQEVKEVAKVKRGKPMTFAQADNASVNPNYLNNKPGLSYGQNCQSCVVCYNLRLRGFDVQTKGIPVTKSGQVIKSGKMYEVALNPEIAWIDPKTGMPPETNICNVNTPEKAYEWFDSSIKDNEIYSFRMVWKKENSGHIVIAQRVKGQLFVYDPQTNKRYDSKEEIMTKYFESCRLRTKEVNRPYLFRTDNMDINTEYADEIVEKS